MVRPRGPGEQCLSCSATINEAEARDWMCIWCQARLCAACYVLHTERVHPAAYTVPGLLVAHWRRQRDYR